MIDKTEICVIEQPDSVQAENLCCVVSGGRFWANERYITDRTAFNYLLLLYVEDGAMLLIYAGKKYIVNKGEAFFIDCNEHQVYGTFGKSCRLSFVHFAGGESAYLYKVVTAEYGYMYGGYRANFIKDCIQDVMKAAASHSQRKVELYSSIVINTLYGMLNHHGEPEPLFEKAAELIRAVVAQNAEINVEELARQVGYSKFYFTKRFTDACGIAPFEFIIRERITLAKSLLMNTAKPISDIALDCGFYDASHMTNCFRKREGLTPLAFRREGRKTF